MYYAYVMCVYTYIYIYIYTHRSVSFRASLKWGSAASGPGHPGDAGPHTTRICEGGLRAPRVHRVRAPGHVGPRRQAGQARLLGRAALKVRPGAGCQALQAAD